MNKTLSYQDFMRLVQQMRRAQMTYFKSRLVTDLISAKKLESVVDAFVAGINQPAMPLFYAEGV
jgi:hypothetical protein